MAFKNIRKKLEEEILNLKERNSLLEKTISDLELKLKEKEVEIVNIKLKLSDAEKKIESSSSRNVLFRTLGGGREGYSD